MIKHRPSRAITLKLVAVFLFMLMAAMIKVAVREVPPGQAVFFRSAFAMPVILAWLWQRGHLPGGLRTNNPLGHVWRGLIGTTAMVLTFSGLGLLPLPEVTAIGYATPLFTVLLAAMLLGERVRFVRLTAVALGLFGVAVVIWPRLAPESWQEGASLGALCILGAALLRALVQIHVRRLVQTEDTAAIVFYFALTAVTLSLLTLPFGWVIPSALTLAMLIGAGLIGGVAQILVTSAARFGPASMLAPFDYASLIFAAVIGYVLFGEGITAQMALGAAFVVAGGVLIIWRERQLSARGVLAR